MIEFIQNQAIKLLGGGLLLALVVIGIIAWRADTISEQRDAAELATITEQVKHEVTLASLASLSARMEALVEQGQLRKERLSEALVEVERETAPMRDQADRLERGEIDISEVKGL